MDGPAARKSVLDKFGYGAGSIAFRVKSNGFGALLILFYNPALGLLARAVGLAVMITLVVGALIHASILPTTLGRSPAARREPKRQREERDMRMMLPFALSLLVATPTAAQTPSGEILFKQRCGTCHTIDASGSPKPGPPLRGVVGRKAGAVAGYAYSPALKRSGLAWDKANLDAYLVRPTTKVPGTKMLIGVPSPEQRTAIISYLASQK